MKPGRFSVLVMANGLLDVAAPPVKSAVVEVLLLPEICSPPLPPIKVAMLLLLPERDTAPMPPIKEVMVVVPVRVTAPLPPVKVVTVVLLPERDIAPMPPVKVARLLSLPESVSEPLPAITRLVVPAPPPRVPLKVLVPLAEFRVSTELVVAALLVMLPPPPVPSASEATCWLHPARSSVAPEETTSGVATGRSLVLLGVETEAVPTTSSSA